jgi:hypothetical protein
VKLDLEHVGQMYASGGIWDETEAVMIEDEGGGHPEPELGVVIRIGLLGAVLDRVATSSSSRALSIRA